MRYPALLAMVAVLALAVPARAEMEDALTLDRQPTQFGDILLQVGKRLTGPAKYRDAVFGVEVSETRETEPGIFESGGESLTALHRVARRKPLALQIDRLPCQDAVAVFGTATRAVRRVELVRRDGTTTPLPRRKVPRAWKYKGYMLGDVLVGGSPIVSAQALGSGGKTIAFTSFPPPGTCPA